MIYPKPSSTQPSPASLQNHMRESLSLTISAYPHWCGHLKRVESLDGSVPPGADHFQPHAKRYNRLYTHFGTADDPGVEFQWAKSSVTFESLYPARRTEKLPLWERTHSKIESFTSQTSLASPWKPGLKTEEGLLLPLLAIRVTQLACGGLVCSATAVHAMADIGTLLALLKDWASVSQACLRGEATPLSVRTYDSQDIDCKAAGDINTCDPDLAVLQHAKSLPRHRYDVWASSAGCGWDITIPPSVDTEKLEPVGEMVPWEELDCSIPLSTYTIHFSKDQIDTLYARARNPTSGNIRLSQHDVLLAHIWSRIATARGQADNEETIYCDVVFNLRAPLGLTTILGCPFAMMYIGLPAKLVATHDQLATIAESIRKTVTCVKDPESIAANLHSVAYDSSPQRVAEYFVGRRHCVVTTWARFGIYDVDFGLGTSCAYVEPIIPYCDGLLVIKEAPSEEISQERMSHWTAHGVDVTVSLLPHDMKGLLLDPQLLP